MRFVVEYWPPNTFKGAVKNGMYVCYLLDKNKIIHNFVMDSEFTDSACYLEISKCPDGLINLWTDYSERVNPKEKTYIMRKELELTLNCILNYLTENTMKKKSNAKPVKKSVMPSRPVKPSYAEPMRPMKPNTTSDKKRMK